MSARYDCLMAKPGLMLPTMPSAPSWSMQAMGAVRAVGTSFAVRKKDTLIDVTVTGGRVVLANIKRESEKALAPLLLATLEAGPPSRVQ